MNPQQLDVPGDHENGSACRYGSGIGKTGQLDVELYCDRRSSVTARPHEARNALLRAVCARGSQRRSCFAPSGTEFFPRPYHLSVGVEHPGVDKWRDVASSRVRRAPPLLPLDEL